MKKTILIMVLVSLATCQIVTKSDACSCAQLVTFTDCGRNFLCQWNLTKQICEITQNTEKEISIKNYGKSLYCEGLAQNDCLNKYECAWIDNKCTFFTSCTPFQKVNKDDCFGMSKRCTSDGQTCVEIELCSNYLASNSCFKSKLNYCIWNEVTKQCSDVSECSELPSTLTKDSECRSQLKKECTAKSGGGCVESGTNCEDQASEVGCVTNKARTVNCFWGNGKCYDKTCENALTSNTTHDDCQRFSDKCTAKEKGGCVLIRTCSDGKISEGCKIDSTGKECYWSVTENKCKDKLCINAPNTLKTNQECQDQLLPSCITNGAGCVDDISCGSSIVADQCDINRFDNKQCTWNGTCKDKTCDNAGSENIGHEQCSNYSSNCTGKSNNAEGCQIRICENAPITINTISGCEEYLPNKNCIAQVSGGCVTNTTCSAIQIQDICIVDVKGNPCYWDSVGNSCLDRTCESLPARFNTHSLCNAEINTCTVNSSGTCVDFECENIIHKDNCITNKDGVECIYNEFCYQKYCNAAPQTYTTHGQCQEYLEICTLSNTKKGCRDLPINCSELPIKENCELKSNGDKCGWTGSSCIDFICSTAPTKTSDEYTVDLCEAYKPKSNCVPNETKKGCMELDIQCESRKIKEQCDVAGTKRNGGKTCLWDGSQCFEKTCANATRESYVGRVLITDNKVQHDDCQRWLSDKDGNPLCVVGTTNNVCVVSPTSCSGLGENSCLPNVLKVLNGDSLVSLNCYWNLTKYCVDGNVCANLDKVTHDECSIASNNKCTISADGTNCVDRLECNQYAKKAQCVKDLSDSPCKWTGADTDINKCIDLGCINSSCQIKKNTCAEYASEKDACLGGTVSNKQQCQWNVDTGICQDAVFDCTKVKGTGLTVNYCQFLNSNCSVNKTGDACVVAKASCSLYISNIECKWAINTTFKECYWRGNACVNVPSTCDQVVGYSDEECKANHGICIFNTNGKCKPNALLFIGTYTYDDCQSIDTMLGVKNNGSGCYYIDKNCQYLSTSTCTMGLDGPCYVNGTACVSALTTPLTSATCGSVTKASNGNGKLTSKYCLDISGSSCVVYFDGTKCTNTAYPFCSSISTTNCYYYSYNMSKCILNDRKMGCINYTPGSTTCSQIVIGGGHPQTHEICQFYSNKCTATNPISNACTDYIGCEDYKGTYTFQNCLQFNTACSVNFDSTGCVLKQDYCIDYILQTNCGYAGLEGPCIWDITQKCIQKSCDWIKDLPNPSLESCSAQQSNCNVLSNIPVCIMRGPCSSYTAIDKCTLNNKGQQCLWNTIDSKCYDKTCENADSTYDTHQKCQDIGKCTVKVGVDGTTLGGCINLDACLNYQVAAQCKINATNIECEWSLAQTPNKCVDKSCISADPNVYTDFNQCQNYYKAGECALGSKKNEDGTYTKFGCMPIALCSEYKISGQCKFSKNKDADDNYMNCYWNETTQTCGDASCAQADDTFTTHNACVSYGNAANLKCTVDKDNKGCVPIPATCEEMTKGQCVNEDAKLKKCIWLENSGTGSCVTRTCQNAINPTSPSDCQKHLLYCTMSDNKCKTKTCEDYYFTEDSACAALFKDSKCTTNGIYCVNRGQCNTASCQSACTTDQSGNLCEWIFTDNQNKSGYCVLKSCNTAPKTYVSEGQCLQYFTPKSGNKCNTQYGGGCVERTTCSAAQVEAACNTNASGFLCGWDSQTSTCRNQECQDISGTTHAYCQNPSDKNLKGKCTAGKEGRCAPISNCTTTTIEAACVVGTDGPCIWLPDYPNDDNTKGACFPYDSCKSLQWTSDTLCKYISDKCTTDGTSCIGITSCDKTNVNGGCVTGTDGTCITTVQTLGSENKFCSKYLSCSLALFTTHSDCQAANPKCTTNGSSFCIELTQCSLYVKDACHFNNEGKLTNTMKQVTSTGQCIWDHTANVCRDENCIDLQGATDSECSSQLITCTTDGTNCILKDSCTKYTKNSVCINALGIEGLCTWDLDTKSCRVKTCNDIIDGTNLAVCSIVNNCITDGAKCISVSTCDQYTTKVGCNSQGTDGICIWTETKIENTTTGKCSLMINCLAATIDQNACQQASDRCKWTPPTATTGSSCVDHTCESFRASSGRCSYFPNWDSTKINICSNVNGQCMPTDPKVLLEAECYNLSAYMYSWNSNANTCSKCFQTAVTPNNSTIRNDINQTDNSGYILGAAIFLGYIIH